MPHVLTEAAIWFAQPGDEGISFETLAEAVLHAASIARNDRHRGARICTSSGATYGWNAIEEIWRRL